MRVLYISHICVCELYRLFHVSFTLVHCLHKLSALLKFFELSRFYHMPFVRPVWTAKSAQSPYYGLNLLQEIGVNFCMSYRLLILVGSVVAVILSWHKLSQLSPSYKGFNFLLEFKTIFHVMTIVMMEATIFTLVFLEANTHGGWFNTSFLLTLKRVYWSKALLRGGYRGRPTSLALSRVLTLSRFALCWFLLYGCPMKRLCSLPWCIFGLLLSWLQAF